MKELHKFMSEENFRKKFGARLGFLLKEKGITQKDLNVELGKKDGYVRKITSGAMMPGLYEFFHICHILDVSPACFQTDSDEIVATAMDLTFFMNNWKVRYISDEIPDELLQITPNLQQRNEIIEKILNKNLSNKELQAILQFTDALKAEA